MASHHLRIPLPAGKGNLVRKTLNYSADLGGCLRESAATKAHLPTFLRTAHAGEMKAKGLVWALFLLLAGGGGCQPSAQQAQALLNAVKLGDLGKVKALLNEQPALVFSKDTNGMTPLHLVVWCDDAGVRKEIAELLLAHKAEVNARSKSGTTALHEAASVGDKDTAELLLANKAELDAKPTGGRTPLHVAALAGHTDLAELLLASKADVNAKDKDGLTPLHVLAGFNQYHDPKELAQLLLAKGAEVNAVCDGGFTPLHWAAVNHNKDVAEVLLANKAEVNAKDKTGSTPLHCAAASRNKEMVQLLLANKAEVNAKDTGGRTPLRWAAKRDKDVAEVLRQHGGQE